MSVLDHPVLPMCKIQADTPYSCINTKRKHGYWTYQRQYFDDGNFMMTYVYIEDVMSRLCRYIMRATDLRCGQCQRESDVGYFKEMGV